VATTAQLQEEKQEARTAIRPVCCDWVSSFHWPPCHHWSGGGDVAFWLGPQCIDLVWVMERMLHSTLNLSPS